MTAQLALKSMKKHLLEVAEVLKKRARSAPMKKLKKSRAVAAEAAVKMVQVAPKTKNMKTKDMMNQPVPVVEAATSSSTVRAAEKMAG